LHWVRRSRGGWDWIDGSDAPLVEESERYRVSIIVAENPTRMVETTVPQIELSAADREQGVTVDVVQLGSRASSLPATLSLYPVGES
jgi:hypothetical protein